MTSLTQYLLKESKLHPSLAPQACLAPQDVVKLCYQAAFGAEHMLSDKTQALNYFKDEYSATPADDKPLAVHIAPTVCRVNLSAWKRLKLNPDWLWNLFVGSASPDEISGANNKIFEDYLTQAGRLSQADSFPFSHTEWQKYIHDYKRLPVRHSEAYRDKVKPAYRILSGLPAMMLPIFEAMAGLESGVIAIDGRAASGKSTLAGYMSGIIHAGLIAMDDFFLPPELRTKERLAQPGGNIHHERFAREVLPYIRSNKGFEYGRFDCSRMEYSATPVKIPPSPWRIVEGVYSLHPALNNYMNVRVFLDIEQAEQKTRIQARNNAKIAADYFAKWIPMEETYFKEFNISKTADAIIFKTHLRSK